MPCKCHVDIHLCLTCSHLLFLSLAKALVQNSWIDEVKVELCRILNERKKLVTIFKFDDKRRHHGNLEDAILETLLNGDD
jgi:LEA14-like dessication related protein